MKALISIFKKKPFLAIMALGLLVSNRVDAQFTMGIDKGYNWKFDDGVRTTTNSEVTNLFFGMTGVRGNLHWGARVIVGQGNYSFEDEIRRSYKTKGMNFEVGWIASSERLFSPMITAALGGTFFNYDGYKLEGAYGMEAGAGVFIGKYGYSYSKGTWKRIGVTVQAVYQDWSAAGAMDYSGAALRIGFRSYLDGGYE